MRASAAGVVLASIVLALSACGGGTAKPFRIGFVADAAQAAAGLGSYAYRTLGWRTAATMADDIPYGWETAAGFVAEFCALGGRVVERRWVPVGADAATVMPAVPRSADGVFLG